jgi:hypothetical protein
MAAVGAGHYRYAATVPSTIWSQWMRSDPAFTVVARDSIVVVFEVTGSPDLSCPGQPLAP